MAERPAVWTTRLTTPGAGAFATLFGLESASRALVTVALPIQTLAIVGSDEGVSALFLFGSLASLSAAAFIPPAARRIGRARLCSLAILTILVAAFLFTFQTFSGQVLGFALRSVGIAVFFAVMSMFVMEHIHRQALGRSEPLRMLSMGLAWTVGPIAGVQIEALWGEQAPFLASGLVAVLLFVGFWTLRLSDLPIVAPAAADRTPEVPPPFLENLAGFLRQPRLLLALLHATGRGVFWVSIMIFTPLFAVESGLGAAAGGLLVGLSSGFMVLMPLWGWAARRFGIRRVSLWAFPAGALGCFGTFAFADWPWLVAAMLLFASLAMTVIDGYGNALFLRACRPSQRVALTPIFAAQRDLAAILQSGFFAILLIFFPVKAVFLCLGLLLLALTWLSRSIHPRL